MAHNVQTEDIRTPVTVEEAESALDLADSVLCAIESDLENRIRENFPGESEFQEWRGRTLSAEKRWKVKYRQLKYELSRLKAGTPPKDEQLEALRGQLKERDQEIVRLRKQVADLKERPAHDQSHEPIRLAQNDARDPPGK